VIPSESAGAVVAGELVDLVVIVVMV